MKTVHAVLSNHSLARNQTHRGWEDEGREGKEVWDLGRGEGGRGRELREKARGVGRELVPVRRGENQKVSKCSSVSRNLMRATTVLAFSSQAQSPH